MEPIMEKVMVCYHCGNKTSMKIVAEHNLTEHEDIWDYSVDLFKPAYFISFYKQWNIFLCPVCNEITVEKRTHFSEETEPNGKPIYNTEIIYPQNSSESNFIPSSVSKAFEAALKVRNLDGAICIMALRRTLEKMCKLKEAEGKTLSLKLKDLQNKKILPPIMDQISDILRIEGNSAAHADDVDFTPENVRLMIDFTQVILDYVYTLPAKIERAQIRIKDRNTEKNES
jgi:hypothetical protein